MFVLLDVANPSLEFQEETNFQVQWMYNQSLVYLTDNWPYIQSLFYIIFTVLILLKI
jgi:hypothetical protein